jgi:hypothetical protein
MEKEGTKLLLECTSCRQCMYTGPSFDVFTLCQVRGPKILKVEMYNYYSGRRDIKIKYETGVNESIILALVYRGDVVKLR